MADRTEVLHVRLKPESLARLRAAAERDHRTVSDMARLLLVQGLERMEKVKR